MAFYTKYKDKWYEVNLNQASTLYSPADSDGRNTSTTQAEASNRVSTPYSASGNTIYATIASKFTQTISISNGSYIKAWSVSRNTSPEEGATTGVIVNGSTSGGTATVYLNDTLTATATAADIDYSNWNITSVSAPTITTNTDTSVKATNPNAFACTLYWGTTSGATTYSTSIAANASNVTVSSNISAGTKYYFTLKATPTRTKHTYGTPTLTWSSRTVSGANTLTITGSKTDTTESGTVIASSSTSFTTPYKITFTKNDKVKNISLTYTDNSGTSQSVTSTSTTTYYVKKGGSYNYTAAAADYSYITAGASGSSANVTSAVSIAPTANYGYYYVTLSSSNGTIKWGTASNPTASSGIVVQYGSTIHYTIKPNNYYIYGSTTSGSTTSDASVTVNSSNFTFSSVSPGTSSSGITTPTAIKAYNCTAGYYNITLSCTNGTIKYGTTSSPTGTTTIKVQYNGTVYYQITPYSGYKYGTTIGPSSTGVYSASLSSLGVPTTAGTNSSPAPFSKPYSCTAVSGMTLTLSNNTYKGTIRIRSGSASGPLIATWDASVESSYNFTNGTEGTTYYINGEEYRKGLFVYWITTTTFTYTSGGSQTFTVHSQKDIPDICPNEACTSKEGRN